jgi:hypothetical protein
MGNDLEASRGPLELGIEPGDRQILSGHVGQQQERLIEETHQSPPA